MGIPQEKIDKIIEYRKEGLSYWQIESLTNVTYHTISKYCKLAGLEEINVRRKSTPEEREEARKLYLMGFNASEIGRKLNRQKQVVSRWLDKMDVELDHKWQRNNNVTEIPLLTVKPEVKEIKRVEYNGKKYIDVSEVYGL